MDIHNLPLKPKKHAKPWTAADDAYLREWAGLIDVAMLAAELRRPRRHVLRRMVDLGLRKCTHASRKADCDAAAHP